MNIEHHDIWVVVIAHFVWLSSLFNMFTVSRPYWFRFIQKGLCFLLLAVTTVYLINYYELYVYLIPKQ